VTEESGHVVRIERTFAASAEDVFDAWTSPEVMRRWFHCAPDWDTPEAEVDLRVGGKVRVVMRRPDGTEVEAQGTLLLGVRGLDHGADGQQRHLDRRAPRRPGRGVARVLRRARAGIGRLIRRTRDRMETHFPGESAGCRAARDRLRRITPAIPLIAVESLSVGVHVPEHADGKPCFREVSHDLGQRREKPVRFQDGQPVGKEVYLDHIAEA
jgi:Activator of Hsp90 ATPase homolog 1-like protein